jgi:hypothetical protein
LGGPSTERFVVSDTLTITQIIGIAGSVSLLSGWRLYLCLFATGLAMRLGLLPLPEHLESLRVLANSWVLGAAGLAAFCEFFADKVALLDSVWDAVHTFVRPVGGALLALAIVDAQDPAWQAVVFLLGGGAALISHGGKASARAVVNASPEPVSNIVVSTGEDIATGTLLALALAYPAAAAGIALVTLLCALAMLVSARRILRRLLGRKPAAPTV